MFKVIAFLKRKQGMSKEDFREYFENVHSPKCAQAIGSICTAYRRNYVEGAFGEAWGALAGVGADAVDFDVVTETCFNSMADVDKLFALFGDPSTKLITEDEYNLFDRSAHRLITVETFETDLSLLRG